MNSRIRINRIPAAIFLAILVTCLLLYVNTITDDKPHMYQFLRFHKNEVSLRKLLIASIQAAQRGGFEVMDVAYNSKDLKERSKGKTDEGANDPFTEADGRSHCVMKQGIQRLFPGLSIFSEEDKVNCIKNDGFELDPTVLHDSVGITDEWVNMNDITLWIDPLDATQEFTEKLYQYVTTMVCVAVRGKPIIGVIYNPFNGQTAWALIGSVNRSISEYLQTIYNNGRDENMQPGVTVTVSRSHPGQAKNLTRTVFGEKSKILTAAGAGYKVLQVVSNNATVYLHSTKIKKWDICAGDAILTALGGTMTTFQGARIEYGPKESVVNEHGVFATLHDHKKYLEKLIAYQTNKGGR